MEERPCESHQKSELMIRVNPTRYKKNARYYDSTTEKLSETESSAFDQGLRDGCEQRDRGKSGKCNRDARETNREEEADPVRAL